MCIPNPAPYVNVRPWHRRLAFRRAASFYLAISPWLIGFILMSVIPLIVGLLTSFTNYDGLDVSYRWVGLDNYKWFLTKDADAWWGLFRTAMVALISVPSSIFGGFGLAVLLNQRVKCLGTFRTLFYLPSIMPVVVTTLTFKFIYDRDGGRLSMP